MAEGEMKKSEPGPNALSLKTAAKLNQNKLLRLVTLVNNMKRSPWLISRCKESQSHMQALSDLLRPGDAITVAVKLESQLANANLSRYLVLVSTGNKQVNLENAVLGVDVINDAATVGLVLPITADMDIQMDGDGGFNICAANIKHCFHPISVQAMWSALQSLVKAVCFTRNHRQNVERTPYAWASYYHLNSSQECILEWNRMIDVEFSNQRPASESTDDVRLLLSIKRKLRDIMTNEKDIDLEMVSSKYLRERLEAALNVDLMAYRRFVDEEMLIVMGQMDSPSLILDYLYLGSEWNASNIEELQKNRIGYILNVTREIGNFFPGMFKYCNVRVDDTKETRLIRHWNNTYKFIAEAKRNNSRILVHCKMGVSRSASTVIAYVMKEYGKPFIEAYQHVKQKRSCVKPNSGFMDQLNTYEGTLGASKLRHGKLVRSRSAETLDSEIAARDDQVICPEKCLKNSEESQAEGSSESTLSSGDVSTETNPSKANFRQATFSIDSIDCFSPGSLPAITELGGVSLTELCTAEQRALVAVEEGDGNILCDRNQSGISQGDGSTLLQKDVLDDTALPVTSILRKLSCQIEAVEGRTSREHEKVLESVRKLEREKSIIVTRVRRSNSWPQRRRDIVRSPVQKEVKIRPNAREHKKLRLRSSSIEFDN